MQMWNSGEAWGPEGLSWVSVHSVLTCVTGGELLLGKEETIS